MTDLHRETPGETHGTRRMRDRERVAHFKCPHCACFAVSTIVDTRPRYGQDDIRRRHECSECGERYTTIERVMTPQIDAQTA